MNIFKITITPISPFASPLQSDTIWGQCMWMIKFLKGENYLISLLNEIKENKKFFIVSSGFVNDEVLLPFIPLEIEKEKELQNKFNTIKEDYEKETGDKIQKDSDFLFYLFMKKNKQKKMKINEIFKNTNLNIQQLYNLFDDKKIKYFISNIKNNKNKSSLENKIQENISVIRNRINRLKNTVDIGALFDSYITFYAEQLHITIYIKTDCFNIDELKDLFENFGKYGYGADSSIGKGLFKVIKIEQLQIEENKSPNYILSLSNYIPDEKEVVLNESYYSVFLKQGKLGSEYSGGINGNTRSYVKVPLIMIKEGSLLKVKENKQVYGKIITDVNKYNSNIIHSGQTFDIKLNLSN
ncbi:MAG: hypothetical protein N3E50_07430 [Candidatus Goldbacteria bacterium]|nr:hypothetical protein [Candidatus Goldiibacteriota bacterium]